jgi:hypothetical protein
MPVGDVQDKRENDDNEKNKITTLFSSLVSLLYSAFPALLLNGAEQSRLVQEPEPVTKSDRHCLVFPSYVPPFSFESILPSVYGCYWSFFSSLLSG